MSSYSAMIPPPIEKEKNGVPEAFVYRGGEDDFKSGEVREQFAKFFQETSFTALTRIYNASSLVKRLTWLIVVLGMLAWLTVQCYWLLSRFFSYPMEVKIDLVAAQEIEFPSITVCNLNPLRESKFREEPFWSALEQHMELQTVDPLYSMFNQFYYDDWYDDYKKNIRPPDDTTGITWQTNGITWTTQEGVMNNPTIAQATTSGASAGSNPDTTTSQQKTTPGVLQGGVTNVPSTTTDASSATPTPTTSGPPTEPDPTTTTTAGPSGPDPTTAQPSTTPGASGSDPPTTGSSQSTSIDTNTFTVPTHPTLPDLPRVPPNTRRKRQIDMSTFLKERAFNKWDVLDNANVSETFYEDRDKEYIASMAFAVFSQQTDPKIMIEGGHPANNFFIDCKMAGFPCSPKNFTTFVNHKYGNCYTFNSAKLERNGEKLKTRFAGPAFGLTLELYLNQQEYIPALAPAAGARILIHPKNSMPFPEDEGISIAPGYSTSIGLRKVDIVRLPPPHGVCAQSGKTEDLYKTSQGTDYSKLSCLKSCYQSLVIKHCNCSLPSYFVKLNSTVCNMTDSEKEKCSKKLPDEYPQEYSQCDKNCPQPCSETRYEKTVSLAQWPSEKYAKHLQTKVQQSNYMFYGNEVEEEDFAKVEIYFEDLLYQSIEQQVAYESQNLISDIGGQLGLWLGLSAITLGELFSFVFSLGQAVTRGMVHNKKKHSSPIEPMAMGPVSYM